MSLPSFGLCGFMRSGKDTIADYLIEQYRYTRLGFAQALKEEVARGVGCTPADLDEEPLRAQVRPVLQVWGTEFRRGQDPDYWVKQAEQKIETHQRTFFCDECGQSFSDARESHDRYLGRGEGPFFCGGTLRQGGPLVFNDVRFRNEIDMLRRHGFVIVKIDMPVEHVISYMEEKGVARDVTEARLQHASEREWQDAEFDAIIPSVRGDIAALYDAIEGVIKERC